MLKRAALWLLASSALLLTSFSAVVLGLYGLILAGGAVAAEQVQQLQILLVFYFRIVFFQGLLPGLVLALALWPGVVRLLPGVLASRRRLLGGLVLAASVAYAVVAPLLLTAQTDQGAGLRIEGAVDQVASFVGIVGGVALSAWLPRAFLRPLRQASGWARS